MKRGSEEMKDETSPSPTKRLRCREISPAEDINIPLDLTVEIMKKLPAKSLVRFQCVSKQWSSIIGSRRDFIDSIVTRSLTRPPRDTHLIFHHYLRKPGKSDHYFIFSSTNPQNTDKESVPTPGTSYQHVRGLILSWSDSFATALIYNPTTRQFLSLPQIPGYLFMRNYFIMIGYEPFENQYKVVCLCTTMGQPCQVFTLGDPIKEWRNIQCNTNIDFPIKPAVCVSGTIYYLATKHYRSSYVLMIMSFDVRSEKFYLGEAPKLPNYHKSSSLINYHGKLGYICCCNNSIEIWVMEEAEKKQEWSKTIFYEMEGFGKWHIAGATRCGGIIFLNMLTSLPLHQTLYVYYYDPKRNCIRRRVEATVVEDTEYRRKSRVRIWAVPDHVENTMRL